MTAAIFCYSRTGCETARRVLSAFTAHDTVCYTLARFAQPGFLPLEKDVYGAEFSRCGALIFIGACGIAPAVTINGKVYPKVKIADVQKIIDEYRRIGSEL